MGLAEQRTVASGVAGERSGAAAKMRAGSGDETPHGYAILEECTKSGSQYWVRIGGPNNLTMIAASGRQPLQLYADRSAAEHDAQMLRQRNLRDVDRSRWWRPGCRTEPATYTVIKLRCCIDRECNGAVGWTKER